MKTHSNTPGTRRRVRRIAAILSLLSLLVGAFIFANPNRAHEAGRASSTDTAQPGNPASSSAGNVPGVKTRPEQANAPSHPHTIASISTEPSTLCARRPFLATVKLNPSASASQVFIAGKPGESVVLDAFEPGPLTLTATAYDEHGRADTHSFTAEVVPCDEAPLFTLAHRIAAADQDEVLVEATPVQGLQGNISWRWKFDDAHEVDSSNSARHSYRTRPQTSPSSTFPISVTATDEKGVKATSYLSVELTNGEWALAQRGIWHMPVAAPRFPTITDKHIEANLTIRNIDPSRHFEVDAILVKATSCLHPDKTLTETFAPAKVLSLDTVKPGELLDTSLTIPRREGFDACRWSIELKGSLDETTTASAFLSLEQGAPEWIKPQLDREEIKRAFRARILQAGERHVRADSILPVVTPR